MGVAINTRAAGLFRLFTTNDLTAGTTFTNPIDTQTKPVQNGTSGYIEMGGGSSEGPNGLVLLPLGRATTANFLLAVYGCDEIIQSAGNPRTWTHYLLASFAVTLGAQTGLAASDVVVADIYASAITIGVGNSNVSTEVISPATTAPVSGNKASIRMDNVGSQFVKVLGVLNASATQWNCLARRF